MNSNSFLPPDYSSAQENEFPQSSSLTDNSSLLDNEDDFVDDDDDLSGISEEELEELESSSAVVNDKEDFEINSIQQQKQLNEQIMSNVSQSAPPFGSVGGFGNVAPSSPATSPWQTPGSSIWGGGQGNSFQRSQNPTTPWGSQPSSSPWGASGSGIGGQRVQINRSKKVIFCDFIDGVVEAYGANGKPGLRPRDIYDLHPRFEVWDKLMAFNPEKVYFTIPASLIPESANGINAWNVTLSYFCCSISSYLRIPFNNCQILKQNHVGQSKESVLKAVLDQGGVSPEDAVVIGIYSGSAGLSDMDQIAANRCGIDYIDLNTLLTSMF